MLLTYHGLSGFFQKSWFLFCDQYVSIRTIFQLLPRKVGKLKIKEFNLGFLKNNLVNLFKFLSTLTTPCIQSQYITSHHITHSTLCWNIHYFHHSNFFNSVFLVSHFGEEDLCCHVWRNPLVLFFFLKDIAERKICLTKQEVKWID